MVLWNCPGCGEQLEAPESEASSVFPCPRCGVQSKPVIGVTDHRYASSDSVERHLDRASRFLMNGAWYVVALYVGWTTWVMYSLLRAGARFTESLASSTPGGTSRISSAPTSRSGPTTSSVIEWLESVWILMLLVGWWALLPLAALVIGYSTSQALRFMGDSIRIQKKNAGLPCWGQVRGVKARR